MGGSPQLQCAAETPKTDYHENVANICSLEEEKSPSRRPQPRTKPHFWNRRCYLGRCAASRPLIGPGVARRLRRGGGHGRDGALVLRNLGLRVPEVEVPRVAVDEPPPRFWERRIRRRVARALGRRRGRRRRHPPAFSCTLPHSPPTTDQSDQKRHKRDKTTTRCNARARRERDRVAEGGKRANPTDWRGGMRVAKSAAAAGVGEEAEAIGVFSSPNPLSQPGQVGVAE